MKQNYIRFLLPLLTLAFAIFSGYIIHKASSFVNDQHFSKLAHSFINNDLFLSPYNLPAGDYVDYFGKQYLFFGPMPSILLMPFVYLWGINFPQWFLAVSSLFLIYAVIFFLCHKLRFDRIDSFWLANFFVFGTVLYFVGLVNISAYLVQALGTAFLVLSLLEYFGRRRWFLIGLALGAAGATRITLFGMTVFFLLEIYRNRKNINFRRGLVFLMIPILFSISMLSLYNFRRFHSLFDSGYTKNVSAIDKDYYNHILGFFSPIHVPANLYALLFMAPEAVKRDFPQFVLSPPYFTANGFGMAIWFTSPLFLYLILTKKRDYTLSALAAIVITAIPSLFYWGIGAAQFGYRYSLDFLPLLFLVLLPAFDKGLPIFAKFLITGGIVFNSFYMLSIWGYYPIFSFWKYLN